MPLSQGEVERRIERNTNDIESIYEILSEHGEVLNQHTEQLREIQQQLTGHDVRFDAIDATLVEVLRRLPEQPDS